MSTYCLTCLVSTGIGEMFGDVGLPTLDERPRKGRRHPLAAKVVDEKSAGLVDQDSFGFIDVGFRAIGLHLHAHDHYHAFLTSHAGHRIYLLGPEPDWDVLLPGVKCRNADGMIYEPTKFIAYKQPKRKEGYVRAGLVFECSRCDETLDGDEPGWVKPFTPKTLTAGDITAFCKHVANDHAETNFYEAEPFGFLYSEVGEWLREHKKHGVVMRLKRDK